MKEAARVGGKNRKQDDTACLKSPHLDSINPIPWRISKVSWLVCGEAGWVSAKSGGVAALPHGRTSAGL